MDCNVEVCKLKFENLEKKVGVLEVDVKDLKERTDDIKLIKQDVNYIKENMRNIDAKLNKILEKPSKRWDVIITAIIVALASSGVAFLIGR